MLSQTDSNEAFVQIIEMCGGVIDACDIGPASAVDSAVETGVLTVKRGRAFVAGSPAAKRASGVAGY